MNPGIPQIVHARDFQLSFLVFIRTFEHYYVAHTSIISCGKAHTIIHVWYMFPDLT